MLSTAVTHAWTLYMSGNISLAEAEQQVQQGLDAGLVDFAKTNKVDLSKYK